MKISDKKLRQLVLESQRMKQKPYLFWSKPIVFGVTFVIVDAATKHWYSDIIEANELMGIGLKGVFVGLVIQVIEYLNLKYRLKKHRVELDTFEKKQAEVDKIF
tara:strand:+ start:121 stop:432 length:312 start_codon:yes stop_codon:yes gene_type:complete